MARSATAQAVPGSLRSLLNALRPSLHPDWLNQSWFQHRDGAPEVHVGKAQEVLRQVLYQDVTRSPLPALLRYEDRNSMAHSIDNRLPFLTPQIAEFARSLPEEYLVSPEATGKAVLREAMRGLLPNETLNRKDKQGFPVPISEWLLEMEPWARRWLREADQLPFLDQSTMNQVSQRFFGGGKHALADAFLMWRWIFVAGWARQFELSFD
jgi:asparagine synthase (glutamine-hydrolysing)